MSSLRFKSFVCLLESNGYFRKSLKGLRKDMPSRYAELKHFYEEMEAYQILEILVNNEDAMDSKYMIWVKVDSLPHVFEIKENYSTTETAVFSIKTEISINAFQEVIAAVSL